MLHTLLSCSLDSTAQYRTVQYSTVPGQLAQHRGQAGVEAALLGGQPALQRGLGQGQVAEDTGHILHSVTGAVTPPSIY